jgi:hypothetical protein
MIIIQIIKRSSLPAPSPEFGERDNSSISHHPAKIMDSKQERSIKRGVP